MPKKYKAKSSCGEPLCYKVSAVIAVDARGQTVLPKDVRRRLGIAAGDKLAVIIHDSGGEACCMSLMKIDNLSRMVRGPMRAILQEGDV
ncbi:MAG: AbrB/MazE/SpoVT family DNA-binding domain-containing protein [Euryarchaeota archaeon]|nr:AbrB/MazE/SpoVT family DNA-binding domain-containing protein [Euryarchaeota archaeon]